MLNIKEIMWKKLNAFFIISFCVGKYGFSATTFRTQLENKLIHLSNCISTRNASKVILPVHVPKKQSLEAQ